jgi:predicted porin
MQRLTMEIDMQRKILAVAVAGALGLPSVSMAQSSSVQIFGSLYIEYSNAHQGQGGVGPSGTIANRSNVDFLQSSNSELGFKGEEKLGGGLAAWFQCASTADFRESGTPPNGTADGLLCSRNSALGLKGTFGNLYIGRWNTPFKRTIAVTNVGGNDTGIFGTAFLLTGGSTSTTPGAPTTRATFKRREANTVFYDSPNLWGLQVMGAFSAANGTGTTGGTAAIDGATASKPRVLSLGAQYTRGPLYVSAAYERHNQFAAVGGENNDQGWHGGATYRWGPVLLGGQYTRQSFDNSGAGLVGAAPGAPSGGATSARYSAWTLGADWAIVGPHGLRAAYTSVGDAKGNATILAAPGTATTNTLIAGTYRPAPCLGPTAATAICDGTGASLAQIRYVYTLSKRTELDLGYVSLHNRTRAAYSLGGLSSPQIGTKQYAYAVGMHHSF